VAAGFRTRRIKTENSIGDKLKKARTRKKISVSEVEEATKIRAKFILALESDSWEQIPSEVYGRGYLETYTQYLQLPTEAIMKQYGRERELYARRCHDSRVELAPKAGLVIPRFMLTPRFFAIASVACLMMIGGGAVGYQIKKFSSAPFLELITPAQAKSPDTGELLVSADSVNISGRTAIGAAVQVNGRIVPVDGEGQFKEQVPVQKGANAILVEAVDGKGKKTSEVVNVVAK
jgi:transcriptional regulator with XRE-family HTH domain